MPHTDWAVFDCADDFDYEECDGCERERIIHPFYFSMDEEIVLLLCWKCFEKSIAYLLLTPFEREHIKGHYLEERDQRFGTPERVPEKKPVVKPKPKKTGDPLPQVDTDALERFLAHGPLRDKIKGFNTWAKDGEK